MSRRLGNRHPSGGGGGGGSGQTFASILGASYVDEWDRAITASATTWTSRNGRAITNTGAVTYGADGTNFGGNAVIGTLSAGPAFMSGTGLASLAGSGTFPYLCGVSRYSNPGGNQAIFTMAGATTDQLGVLMVGANARAAHAGVSFVDGPVIDLAVHFWELWADGANFNFAVDGVLVSTADATGTSESSTKFLVGNRTAVSNPQDGFHSRYIVASSPPTAPQRAALRSLAKTLDSF